VGTFRLGAGFAIAAGISVRAASHGEHDDESEDRDHSPPRPPFDRGCHRDDPVLRCGSRGVCNVVVACNGDEPRLRSRSGPPRDLRPASREDCVAASAPATANPAARASARRRTSGSCALTRFPESSCRRANKKTRGRVADSMPRALLREGGRIHELGDWPHVAALRNRTSLTTSCRRRFAPTPLHLHSGVIRPGGSYGTCPPVASWRPGIVGGWWMRSVISLATQRGDVSCPGRQVVGPFMISPTGGSRTAQVGRGGLRDRRPSVVIEGGRLSSRGDLVWRMRDGNRDVRPTCRAEVGDAARSRIDLRGPGEVS